MNRKELVTYSLRGNAVVIHRPFYEDMVLDEESLRAAIEYIKCHKETYASEQAYQNHLAIYEGALLFVVSSTKIQLGAITDAAQDPS